MGHSLYLSYLETQTGSSNNSFSSSITKDKEKVYNMVLDDANTPERIEFTAVGTTRLGSLIVA